MMFCKIASFQALRKQITPFSSYVTLGKISHVNNHLRFVTLHRTFANVQRNSKSSCNSFRFFSSTTSKFEEKKSTQGTKIFHIGLIESTTSFAPSYHRVVTSSRDTGEF